MSLTTGDRLIFIWREERASSVHLQYLCYSFSLSLVIVFHFCKETKTNLSKGQLNTGLGRGQEKPRSYLKLSTGMINTKPTASVKGGFLHQ